MISLPDSPPPEPCRAWAALLAATAAEALYVAVLVSAGALVHRLWVSLPVVCLDGVPTPL